MGVLLITPNVNRWAMIWEDPPPITLISFRSTFSHLKLLITVFLNIQVELTVLSKNPLNYFHKLTRKSLGLRIFTHKVESNTATGTIWTPQVLKRNEILTLRGHSATATNFRAAVNKFYRFRIMGEQPAQIDLIRWQHSLPAAKFSFVTK